MSVEKVREYLKPFGFDNRIRVFDVPSGTVEEASIALGLEAGRIAKSITFHLKDKAIMIVAAGDVKIFGGAFKRFFGEKAYMLTHDEVPKFTGYTVGSVSPFALPSDVSVYLDTSLKRFKTVFPAAGSANSGIELTCEELESCVSNFAGWIDVCKSR